MPRSISDPPPSDRTLKRDIKEASSLHREKHATQPIVDFEFSRSNTRDKELLGAFSRALLYPAIWEDCFISRSHSESTAQSYSQLLLFIRAVSRPSLCSPPSELDSDFCSGILYTQTVNGEGPTDVRISALPLNSHHRSNQDLRHRQFNSRKPT